MPTMLNRSQSSIPAAMASKPILDHGARARSVEVTPPHHLINDTRKRKAPNSPRKPITRSNSPGLFTTFQPKRLFTSRFYHTETSGLSQDSTHSYVHLRPPPNTPVAAATFTGNTCHRDTDSLDMCSCCLCVCPDCKYPHNAGTDCFCHADLNELIFNLED